MEPFDAQGLAKVSKDIVVYVVAKVRELHALSSNCMEPLHESVSLSYTGHMP